MNKIFYIINREYLTRVRKKSFVVMTLLGPILIVGIYAAVFLLAGKTDEIKKIAVVDETGFFASSLASNNNIKYTASTDLDAAMKHLKDKDIDAILSIPKNEYAIPQKAILIYANNEPSLLITNEINNSLQAILKQRIMTDVLTMSDTDISTIENAKITVSTSDVTTGKSGFVFVKSILGILMGILLYLFIFLFGSMVMRGVIEEKTSRIVEVIVSSVRPFQLMMGKIIGIALVGFTQFFLWVVFSFILITAFQFSNMDIAGKISSSQQVTGINMNSTAPMQNLTDTNSKDLVASLVEGVKSIDFTVIIFSFLFLFTFGYFLYASLFAAVGSLIENETDSNQFILPITIPLIITMSLLPSIINNPSGPVAFWLSMIPFTSPVVMMTRIPFGVPYWQIIVSMSALLLTFLVVTWFAAKIYRTGILMYGKKITYKEIWKWFKYKI